MDTLNFQSVIADEAHYFKNWQSKRSQTLLPLLTRARRVILISGTPVLNRPSEIYNLVKTLRPDIIRSFLEYAWRYCEPKEKSYGMDYNSGSANTRELNFILSQSVMIRRLKKDVLAQLPPKRRQIIEIEPDDKLLRQVKRSLGDFLEDLERNPYRKNSFLTSLNQDHYQDEEDLEESADQTFSTAYRLTGMSKLPGIADFLDTLMQNDTKFLLFAHHTSVIEGLEEIIKKRRVAYIKITGATKVTDRE